jgi:hypothetical protein
MAKRAELKENAVKVLEAIKEAKAPVTAAELKANGVNVNGAELRALADRGYVTTETIEVEVPRLVKTKVTAYTFVEPTEEKEAK